MLFVSPEVAMGRAGQAGIRPHQRLQVGLQAQYSTVRVPTPPRAYLGSTPAPSTIQYNFDIFLTSTTAQANQHWRRLTTTTLRHQHQHQH